MKILFLILSLFTLEAFAGTCTSTTRNNYSTNQVLTSSALNNDFNQIVTKVNAFDGGCVTAGTLEYDALNTTQFAPILKAIKEGCKVSYSNASTISIGKCFASVNNNFVSTTVATTASFGCTSCSAEVSSTTYYVYISTGSTGTTLTPLISTTAPNEDGYDNSGNKVLARFYNNASSDIDQYSIDQWHVNSFIPQGTGWISSGSITLGATTTPPTIGTTTSNSIKFRRIGKFMQIRYLLRQTVAGTVGSGNYLVPMPSGYLIDTSITGTTTDSNAIAASVDATPFSIVQLNSGTANAGTGIALVYSSSQFRFIVGNASSYTFWGSGSYALSAAAIGTDSTVMVPIAGWND
jgi:hypothetical protein